ncbi:hypothetical protein WJX72_011952 [[Myrmecia] bisecta]|uniref:Triacylglycerol lipase n=1 Tax=[Myrmecia] bisecta TaxID=41462 RepID=A0AAW1P7E7_9CHLO
MHRRSRQLGGRPAAAQGPFAGVHSASTSDLVLSVYGLACRLFDSGPLAAAMASGEQLMPCHGDADLLVDRYDVRLLLDNLAAASVRPGVQHAVADAADAEELEYERYRDLDESGGRGIVDPADAAELVPEVYVHPQAGLEGQAEAALSSLPPLGRLGAAGDSYAAVSLTYDMPSEAEAGMPASPRQAEAAEAQRAQQPPALSAAASAPFTARFTVPESLQDHLPETERMHKIIAQTANYVRESAQIEFVLRVKQANNPNFGFLLPGDRLHPYFRWMVKENPQEEAGAAGAAQSVEDGPGAGLTINTRSSGGMNGLSLLSMYDNTETPRTPSTMRSQDSATERAQARVLPAPEMQAIIQKLVKFIQKNGIKFEAVVRQREQANPRFGFLLPQHESHWYYRQQLVEALEEAAALAAEEEKKAQRRRLARELLAARQKQAEQAQQAEQEEKLAAITRHRQAFLQQEDNEDSPPLHTASSTATAAAGGSELSQAAALRERLLLKRQRSEGRVQAADLVDLSGQPAKQRRLATEPKQDAATIAEHRRALLAMSQEDDPHYDSEPEPASTDGVGTRASSAGFGSSTGFGSDSGGFRGLAPPTLPAPIGQQDTLSAWKSKGMNLARFLSEKTSQASTNLRHQAANRDWTKQQTALERVKTTAMGAAERVQNTVLNASKQASEVAQEGYMRLTGGPLAGVCKSEAASRPCPRVIMVCCTAIVVSGLNTEQIFQKDAPLELVHYLLGAFEESAGLVLPPPGTSPHVLAGVVKQFLLTLPEPLLTYKLLPEFINAGQANPGRAAMVMVELPASNKHTLELLLETFFRITGNAAVNEMDAHSLGVAIVPFIAWHAPPKHASGKSYVQLQNMSGSPHRDSSPAKFGEFDDAGDASPSAMNTRLELAPEENQAIVRVIENLIMNFRSMNEANSPLSATGVSTTSALLDLSLLRVLVTLSVPFRKLLALNIFIGRAPLQILRYVLHWIGWLSAPPRNPLLRHLGTDFLQTRRWHYGLGTLLLAAGASAARRKWLESTNKNAQLRKKLREAIASATNYHDWSIAATALDQLEGNDSLSRWKRETRLYDRKLLQERLSHLQEVRARGDVTDMMFAVRADLLRNLGNMTNSELHENFPMVPEPIREYIAEVRLHLQTITNYEGPDITVSEKLQFLQETRHAFGRTALVLSGGGALGAFHLGVVKTLFDQKLLPRVLAGSSVGSIVASIIATNDDEQLQKLFDHMREFDLSFFSNSTASQFFNHFLLNGTLQDMEVLQNRLRRLLGDETLLQAYQRTGRVLNVAVTAADTNEPPRILNYLTAPNVVIWSAVACSSAFPLLYTPAKLFAKDTKKNSLVPFTAEAMRETERRWRDGSLEEDLPMRTLSEMFNVNYFLVSQTNPHIVPALNLKKRFNRKLGNLLEAEWKHRCKQLMEVLPDWLPGKFLKVFSQAWEGDVTMVLPSTFWQLKKAITNPSKDDLVMACRQGEQVTWSKLSAIQANCGIETTLDECLIKLSDAMFLQRRQRSSHQSSPVKGSPAADFAASLVPGPALGTSAFVAAGGSDEPLAHAISSRMRNGMRGRNGMGSRIPSWLHLPSLGMPTVPSDESLDSYHVAVRAGSTDDLTALRTGHLYPSVVPRVGSLEALAESPNAKAGRGDLINDLISTYSSRPLAEVPEADTIVEGLPAPEEFPEWSGSAAFDCCDRSVNIWETLLPLASSSMGGQALDVIAP